MHRLSEIDWPVLLGLVSLFLSGWYCGWRVSIRDSGRMYDAGYRAGYSDAGKRPGVS